jgi:MFS family permease
VARKSNRSDGRPGRFTRADHTPHQPRPVPPPVEAGYYPPAPSYPPPYHPAQPLSEQPTGVLPPPLPVGQPAAAHTRPFESPKPSGVIGRGKYFAAVVSRKVIDASKAGGAHESGLTALIWNQVLSYGTDAMITVALAGTVFFGASAHAQRGNVLLYLLVTMAPFAVVAPVIGPTLDRLQHGRRYAMATTAIGRAILALVMAAHPTDLLVLYPCALGSLVLSKAYSVIRAAAAPRLVPPGMTLVQANARLSIFGLASALIGGLFVAGVIKTTGSYTAGLVVTAIAFSVCAVFAFRLPKRVDSAPIAREAPRAAPPGSGAAPRVRALRRLHGWVKRGFEAQVISALQGESTLRLLSGFLTIYLAFWVEATWHGWTAAFALGAVGVAAGAGNFAGTAIGVRLKPTRPERLIMLGCAVAAAVCLLAAILFSLTLAVIAMFISAVANSISKIALDAVIQRDVHEGLRASAFGRSETLLQLSWVLGATIGVLLPTGNGAIGFWVAAAIVGTVAIWLPLRSRAIERSPASRTAGPAGPVAGYGPASGAPLGSAAPRPTLPDPISGRPAPDPYRP